MGSQGAPTRCILFAQAGAAPGRETIEIADGALGRRWPRTPAGEPAAARDALLGAKLRIEARVQRALKLAPRSLVRREGVGEDAMSWEKAIGELE